LKSVGENDGFNVDDVESTFNQHKDSRVVAGLQQPVRNQAAKVVGLPQRQSQKRVQARASSAGVAS
jgi:hypothetical protein